MEIRIKETGAVVFESELRNLYPNTSGPLDDLYDVVFEGPQASGGTVYQYSQRQGVEQVNGKWYTKHVLGPVFTDGETTAAAQEAAYKAVKDAEQATAVRADRTKRLADSDWTQLSDAPITGTAWATYRQALRDITSQAGFPWEITWPDAP
jgi:hypothetical protein